MIKLFRRSNGRLYVEYRLGGKCVQKSTGLLDTPQNRALVKREVIPALERKLLLDEVNPNKPKMFAHYAKLLLRDKTHIKTYNQLVNIVARLNETFGDKRIDRITRGDIKHFVRNRLETNTPKTLGNYLAPLRAIFDIAIDEEVLRDNPAANIKLPPHKTKSIEPFTPQEVTTLLEHANGWMRTFLAIAFYTGLRTGEILLLMWQDIDIQKRIIHVRRSVNKGKITTPKTQGSIRDVPIFDELLPYLREAQSTSPYVLSKDDGKPYYGFVGSKQREWRKLLDRCGIAYRKVYATRHTFIVTMLKNSDMSILEIAQLAGHTNTKMIIQNYAKFIKGEHLQVDRSIKLFADKSADTSAQSS